MNKFKITRKTVHLDFSKEFLKLKHQFEIEYLTEV